MCRNDRTLSRLLFPVFCLLSPELGTHVSFMVMRKWHEGKNMTRGEVSWIFKYDSVSGDVHDQNMLGIPDIYWLKHPPPHPPFPTPAYLNNHPRLPPSPHHTAYNILQSFDFMGPQPTLCDLLWPHETSYDLSGPHRTYHVT